VDGRRGPRGEDGPVPLLHWETLDFGEDTGTPVDMSYDVPFTFTGALGKIVIELK
jgi:arylsulfatase